MRVALLSDIHGNLPALNAVLDDLDTDSVDQVVCLGDTVGYNPWPSACVEQIRDVADLVLKGNHDRSVQHPGKYDHHSMAYEGLKIAKEKLTADQIKWLSAQPEVTAAFGGVALFAHSHPEHIDQYVTPDRFESVGTEYLSRGYKLLALGHTHVQHAETYEIDGQDRVILNPGSVGQPRDKNWKAGYAIVDFETMGVSLHRVEYDVPKVQQKIHDEGLPARTGSRLANGE